MAKTIKFNLICDGYPVRTLDELREHFNIEDILDYYEKGILRCWLKVRGFEKELTAITVVPSMDKLNAAKELFRIFEVEVDQETSERIEQIIRKKELQTEAEMRYQNCARDEKQIVLDYLSSYQALKENMVENHDNIAVLKENVATLCDQFMPIFQMDYRRLFLYLKARVPVALFLMLAYKEPRARYIHDQGFTLNDTNRRRTVDQSRLDQAIDQLFKDTATAENVKDSFGRCFIRGEKVDILFNILLKNPEYNRSSWRDSGYIRQAFESFYAKLYSEDEVCKDAEELKEELCDMVSVPLKLRNVFGEALKVERGSTAGEWKMVAEAKQKCLILAIDGGNCSIRMVGDNHLQYDSKSINRSFRLFDGFEYQSQDDNAKVYYLEV